MEVNKGETIFNLHSITLYCPFTPEQRDIEDFIIQQNDVSYSAVIRNQIDDL